MRRLCLLTLPLLLASCDDDSTGETNSPPTATPAPSPTPSPTPAPSPTPTPSSYPTYDQQTGNVSLLTAQAGYATNVSPPTQIGRAHV